MGELLYVRIHSGWHYLSQQAIHSDIWSFWNLRNPAFVSWWNIEVCSQTERDE